MPDYIFNNTVLTQDDIEEIASIKGYTLDELFEKNPDIKQTDPDEEGKPTPSQETASAAVEESVALEPTVTESVSEDTLSGLSKIEVPQVKTGTVADTKEINKIYQKAAEEAPRALDEILKVREKITTAEITDKTASNYFNLEEVNRKLEEGASITTGFGTQSISEREPTQEEKEERVYNNGLNMPNATLESAQEYLDTYKNYIKTGELIPANNQKEYLAKIQDISKEQLITMASEEVAGNYSESTQIIVENLIDKNKDFKTIEEVNFFIDEGSKIFSKREEKFTKDIEQFNIGVNKWKNEINLIDKQLQNLNKKNNNFQTPAEYTQDAVNQYNTLVNKRNSLIKSPQAQALEEQELNLSQEQSSLIDFQKTVTNKVLKFQNEESALRALEKDYSFSTRAALKMEQAFGGFGATSLAMLAKVGAELMTPGKYGGGFATVALDEKRDNTLIKTADNFLTSAIDYNRALEEKIAKVLPTPVTVKQVGEGKVSFGRFLSEAIANGSPTLVATLGPAGVVRLGSRLAGQAMLKPALSRAAANLSAVLLANQAGGGEMSSLLIAREDAPLKIAQLEENLKSAKDPVEIQKIDNEIATLRDSMNLPTAKIGFAGVLSAGIEGFTERFGTLALINKAAPYVPGTSTFKKILTGGKTLGKGLLQENVEEVIAGISNNILVQNALLKRDVNVFEGVDLDLIANTTVVSAVMLGQGFGANTRNAFLELTTNVEEASRFQSLTRKLIDLQSSNSTDKRKQTKEILQRLGLENMVSLSKLNTMTPQELRDLGNIQTQINKLNREASQFGVSMSQKGEITAADRNTLKKMEEQFEVLRSRKNDLLKTRRGGLAAVEAKEKSSGKQQINNPRFNFYSNSYNAFKVLTEGMMPKGGKYIEFEKAEDLNFTEEQKQKFLENYNSGEKVPAKTFEEAIMGANAWQDGNNIYVNLSGIYQQIIMDDNNSASFAVASPLHELSHIRNRNLKLNDRLVKKAVDDAINIIKANEDNLNKKDYKSILNRLELYKTSEVKYEEFMQVLSDAQATGLINLSDYIDINSFKDLIKYAGAKAFGDLSDIFFKIETSNDVFNYINSYRTIVKKGTRVGSGDKEEIETIIKESKSLTPEVTTDAENRIVELQKLKEETTTLAKSFGKEYAPSAREQRLQNELLNIIDPVISKVAEERTKDLYDKIPAEQKENVSREYYTKSLKNNIFTFIVNEFIKGKQDLEKFIVNRGYLRSNALAKDLGIESTEEFGGLGITSDITESAQAAAETAPEVEIEVAETKPTERLIEVKNKFLSPEGRTGFEENVASRIDELTPDEFTFKKLPNWGKENLAKELNIPIKKFEGSSNFTQAELGRLLTWIETNVSDIRRALPGAAVLEGAPVPESLIGTATGVPNNLLKNINLYERLARGTKDAGLIAYRKLKGIDNNSILKAVSIINGRQMAGPRDKAAQTAKGIFNMMAKVMTNQEIRKQLQAKPRPDITTKETESARAGGVESSLLFAKAMPLNTRKELFKEISNIKDINKYEGLNDNIIAGIRGILEEDKPKTFNQVFNEIKNITSKTLSVASQRQFETDLLKSLFKISEGTASKEDLISAFETYRKLFKYEQKEIGYNFARNYLESEFKNAKNNEAKQEVIKDFLKYISRSIRTLKIDGATTNEAIFNQIVEALLVENKLGFDVSKEKGRTYITFNGQKLKGLQDITEIKKDFRGNVETIKIEAEETLNYYKKIIDQAKEQGTVEQIKGFIALTSADQRGMLRKLSTPGFEIIAPGKKMVLEHETTALELFNELVDYADDKIEFSALQKFVSQAKVNLIPETLDKILNAKSYTGNGKSRYNDKEFLEALEEYKNRGEVIDYSIDAKGLIKLSKSISKAAVKNNLELPKSQRLPKDSTNEQVLAKMQELDNEANEARIKYSKSQNLDDAFNDIIEAKTGIETYKRFSPAKAQVRGASKGKFNFFIPPSAEDFVGLLYKTLARGKLGDNQMQWYKDNLLDPYARAMNDISSARVAMFNDYKQLKEDLKVIPKDLKKKSVDEYTREQAVRVYIWNKQGDNIPGLFKTDQKELSDYVNKDPELKLFTEQLIAIQKGDVYAAPKEGWLAGSITTDFLDGLNTTKRKKYLEQWQTNVDEIFSEVNLNKLEAAFGKPYRNALENILTRMKTGRNKPFTSDSLAGRVTDWLNNSTGAIMFFNTRSAVLQTISSINFINWSDNNIYQAGKAFANQPQYWKDFKFLFNSDFLKERRGGSRFNVAESEIADAAKKDGARGVISKILQAGFLPTQMADSFAIASGGATFYRNRVKSYIKEGLTEAEAQEKAFLDFREIAEESQQSSRPDRISAQQAGPLGRTILAFANTPAQYARLTKKAVSDLVNGRGDAKTNFSKLLYYGFVQNLIFTMLQRATFLLAFGDEDEDEKKKEKAYLSTINGMADGLLRGMGIQGAAISTIKNVLIKISEDAADPVSDVLDFSPPISSKYDKLQKAYRTYKWNKKEMLEKGFSLDNPAYLAAANIISATVNVPLDRVVKKVNNVVDATQENITPLERSMLIAGWSEWELGIQKPKKEIEKEVARGSKRGTSRSGNRPSNRR